jgi:purine-binding chemotaxis protein CheW
VLVCRVAEERYALDLHFLRSVQPARELARVPCTPAYVAGAVNVRGEVVTVLDLGTALGLPSGATPIRSEVLLVEVAGNRVGLLVDEVVGIERLALEELDRAISGREFANGIAGGTTVYLNLAALLTDEQLSVAEEVG